MVVDDIGILVFADDQMAIGADGEVVAVVELVLALALEEQFDRVMAPAPPRDKLEDLAELALPAIGGADEQFIHAHVDTFAPGDQRGAARGRAVAQIICGRFDIIAIDPAHRIARPDGHIGRRPIARIRKAIDDHGLQLSAVVQTSGRLGNKPIKHAVAAILGQIDDARGRIDAGSFVVEPAHRLQWHRLDQPRRSCRDFEHPAMIEREPVAIALSRAGRRFLAGQPAAPWGNAPRTIADRARQRAEFAFHFERARIEHQIGRAAGDDRSVVCAIAMGERAARVVARDHFMVADKDDLIAAKRQAAHAIRLVGYRPAIGHGIAQAR